jgi:2-iminobutanoate/2-iminopropanoate deaminase
MKSPLSVPDAPKAIGPYTQAQVVRLHGGQRLVFTSGQIGLDPRKADLVGPDVAAQTERVLQNLAAVLRGAGLGLEDVVKTTVFLADMGDFEAMNQVYAKHFGTPPPARSTVAVAGLPRGARVEIEALAVGRDY